MICNCEESAGQLMWAEEYFISMVWMQSCTDSPSVMCSLDGSPAKGSRGCRTLVATGNNHSSRPQPDCCLSMLSPSHMGG